MAFHSESTQPTKTIGKRVTYRAFDCDFWHHPFPADLLNWDCLYGEDKKPSPGRIIEYRIVP